jgi:hypothetical protein
MVDSEGVVKRQLSGLERDEARDQSTEARPQRTKNEAGWLGWRWLSPLILLVIAVVTILQIAHQAPRSVLLVWCGVCIVCLVFVLKGAVVHYLGSQGRQSE